MTLRDLMAPVIRGDLYHATRPRRPAAATDPSGVVRDMTSDAEAAAWAKRRALPVSWIPEGATVYDLGCGDGKLRLARPDLTVYGYDVDDGALVIAEERGVKTIRDPNYDDARKIDRETLDAFARGRASIGGDREWPPARFDVLFAMDVVEHMDDPKLDLAVALSAVAQGGLVVVECPDFWSPMAQLYGDRFRLLHDPDHVSLFTGESLVRMLRDLGVMIEDVAFPYYGGPYDTPENAARLHAVLDLDGEVCEAGLSPAAPGNMVCVRGRKR